MKPSNTFGAERKARIKKQKRDRRMLAAEISRRERMGDAVVLTPFPSTRTSMTSEGIDAFLSKSVEFVNEVNALAEEVYK